jgi:DNA (cytosine-5)-methyltransferase 1
MKNKFRSVEICAGGGGQALGLEQAGFEHVAVIEIDKAACSTLRGNRPSWNVIEGDLHDFDGKPFSKIDLLAGGVPCPPFSIAGKQLGSEDERDLFPEALRLVQEIKPGAVMLENVRGLADRKFSEYRSGILHRLENLGYRAHWKLLNASDYNVPQLRPRFILVALQKQYADKFEWPKPNGCTHTVGKILKDLMAAHGWPGAEAWAKQAKEIAPTIVGGSKKHGGPDLGPTRARRQWLKLRVDGLGIANSPPGKDFPKDGNPKLTVPMVARIQGFPDEWQFYGGKTAAYRQVGNAFPPPVAAAVGKAILSALSKQAKIVPVDAGLNTLPLIEMMERLKEPAKQKTQQHL